jgi:hypothetical protein
VKEEYVDAFVPAHAAKSFEKEGLSESAFTISSTSILVVSVSVGTITPLRVRIATISP